MYRKGLCEPILALFLMSLGGLLIHLRIHPPMPIPTVTNEPNVFNWWAAACGAVSVVVLPPLFYYRPTMPVAYVLNAMTVLIGTVTMAYFSIAHPNALWSFSYVVLHSTLPDILVLLAKLPIAHVILLRHRQIAAGIDTREATS